MTSANAPRPTLLFVHGWAFDASFWAPLRAQLRDWPQAATDAGYFGQSQNPAHNTAAESGSEIPPNGPVIAIGHSLGVLKLLRGLPAGCIGMVSINGFPRFGAGPDFEAGVPVRMMDRMAKRLAADPNTVLQDFRQRCGHDAAFDAPRVPQLAQDLQALRDEDQRAALAALSVPLLILAGRDDPIVPATMTQAAFGERPAEEWQWRDHGGHLLPATDAPWCAAHIAAFLSRLTATSGASCFPAP